MKTVWLSGLTPDQKKEMTSSFQASGGMRARLEEMLLSKLEQKRKALRSEESYASPSWSMLQADGLGYERAIFEVISLISQKDV